MFLFRLLWLWYSFQVSSDWRALALPDVDLLCVFVAMLYLFFLSMVVHFVIFLIVPIFVVVLFCVFFLLWS